VSNVVQIHPQTAPWVSKRQLAAHLGRSVRWVELRTAAGMPHCGPTRCFPRNRYNLAEVESWLTGDQPKPQSANERITELERQIAELCRRVEELENSKP
jgi:hypothetical protein